MGNGTRIGAIYRAMDEHIANNKPSDWEEWVFVLVDRETIVDNAIAEWSIENPIKLTGKNIYYEKDLTAARKAQRNAFRSVFNGVFADRYMPVDQAMATPHF